jgi:hypothetical protein
MNRKTYIIDYSAYDIDGILLKTGTIKVKNRVMEIDAKVSLEGYLRRKIPNFHRMVVTGCREDSPWFFGELFGF